MIEIRQITKSYGGEQVLKGISFTVPDGEFVSIMGRSGSGKSTLLNIIGGFLRPDGGEVLYDGHNIATLSDSETATMRCTTLGFVFQAFKLIPTLSVRDNALLPASLSGTDPQGAHAQNLQKNFDLLADKLNIQEIMEKFPDELSGGQCQRVAILRALLYEPKVLILDEPTGALDSENEARVMEILSEVNSKKKTTILMVTHSGTVAEYATRKIILRDGALA